MKKVIALILALVMSLSLVACGQKEEAPAPAPAPEQSEQPSGEVDLTKGDSYTIRVAHSMTDQSSYHKSIEQEFKSVIEEKTGGRITVEIYPSSQLGGERQAFEGVGMGTIEMTLVNGANVANVDPNYAVFDFPFLFDTAEAVYAAMDGEVGAALQESIKQYGYYTLGFGEVGFRQISNSKRAITGPEDLKGIKLRCMENPIHLATWQALGASPTPMALNELFTAMQQGTVDGQENPAAIIYDNKFNEVNDYLSMTGHVFHALCYVVNGPWFESLSAEDQALIAECGNNAAVAQRAIITADNVVAMEAMEKSGMQINYLDEAGLQAFKDATSGILAEFAPDWCGMELIEKAQSYNG